MCNGVGLLEDKTQAPALNKEKIHITLDWSAVLGDVTNTLCGLKFPLTGYGLEGVDCEECLSRVGSYGY